MSKKNEKVNVPVWYAGRRLRLDGTVVQCFVDVSSKQERHFKGISRVYLGSSYLAGKSQIQRQPERTPEKIEPPEKLMNQWYALDKAAETGRAQEIARKKFSAQGGRAFDQVAREIVAFLPEGI